MKNIPSWARSSDISSFSVSYNYSKNIKSLSVHTWLLNVSERDKIMSICLSSFMKLIYEPFLITFRNIYSTSVNSNFWEFPPTPTLYGSMEQALRIHLGFRDQCRCLAVQLNLHVFSWFCQAFTVFRFSRTRAFVYFQITLSYHQCDFRLRTVLQKPPSGKPPHLSPQTQEQLRKKRESGSAFLIPSQPAPKKKTKLPLSFS